MDDAVAHSSRLLKQLKTFEVTARHMSFTRAADELCITQAAVSHQIKTLEDALDVKLFKRMTRAISLTNEGLLLLQGLVDAFAGIDRVLAQLTSSGAGVRRRLTIAVTPAFSSRWLVPRLDRFLAANSLVEVRLVHTVVHSDLAKDDIDLAIRWGDGAWPGVQTEKLFGTELVPVCSPALLREDLPLRAPADLAHYTLLHEDSSDDWTRWFVAAGLAPSLAARGPLIDDSNALMQAAVNGQGIALGRRVLIGDELRSGALVRPFAQTLAAEGAYFMCWRPGQRDSEPLGVFARFLRSAAAEQRHA
jgi:DNA-binding transcriptional LysR family regulator